MGHSYNTAAAPFARLGVVAGVVATLLFGTTALAQQTPPMGPYVGLGLDLAVESFDKFSGDPDFDTGVGFILSVGYRFHPNIAFEGSCEFIDHLDSDDFNPSRDTSILAFNANLKGYLTTLRFQPFVLLGIGVTRFQVDRDGDKDNDAGVTAHFGGGFDYYVVPRISIGLTATYVVTSGKIEDLDHSTIGLGAQYRF